MLPGSASSPEPPPDFNTDRIIVQLITHKTSISYLKYQA